MLLRRKGHAGLFRDELVRARHRKCLKRREGKEGRGVKAGEVAGPGRGEGNGVSGARGVQNCKERERMVEKDL